VHIVSLFFFLLQVNRHLLTKYVFHKNKKKEYLEDSRDHDNAEENNRLGAAYFGLRTIRKEMLHD
jgi:hypothetical protein